MSAKPPKRSPSSPATSPLEAARDDLAAYAAAQYHAFKLPWHLRVLTETLEAVERGELTRVIFCLPPRHGKSVLTSQIFPAWYLGRNPTKSIIASSYGQELASDFGRRVRNFASEKLHGQIFPGCTIADDSDSVHRFHTTAGGAYFAVGAGGPLTGRGADLLLLDDPIKNQEDARSATFRRSLQSWYESTAYTRLEPSGSIILIQTRWHADDLAGWLLREHSSEGWVVISLPAIAETDEDFRHEGEALWPERFNLETLTQIKEAVGGASWASLYMQRPSPEAGGLFNRAWWKFFSGNFEHRRIIFSLDTAFKAGSANDYSVIAIIAESRAGYYVQGISRGRWEFPQLIAQTKTLAQVLRPTAILVEDAASGQSLIQSLKAETNLPILPVRPLGDKVSRAHSVSPLVEAGRVALNQDAPWLPDFLDEATSFPNAAHDDQIDALCQGLAWLHGDGRIGFDDQIISIPYRGGGVFDVGRASGDGPQWSKGGMFTGSGSELERIEDSKARTQLGALTNSRWKRRHGGAW